MTEEEIDSEEPAGGYVDIEYSPSNEFHLKLDLSGMPDGVTRLIDQIAGTLADWIETLREEGIEGKSKEEG
ncbi:hypothetical protein GCM10028857_20690 [Salinarchaeum chitinilyticum]